MASCMHLLSGNCLAAVQLDKANACPQKNDDLARVRKAEQERLHRIDIAYNKKKEMDEFEVSCCFATMLWGLVISSRALIMPHYARRQKMEEEAAERTAKKRLQRQKKKQKKKSKAFATANASTAKEEQSDDSSDNDDKPPAQADLD
ncbi:hypothetical protein QJQ45_025479 [Haematococcus lacustris]|nr:hypothetical protein QJQ45_025479 [Haematococcus lacustris]